MPALEGNALFGLNDHVGVNAHFSPAGLQPGLKITVTRARQAAQFGQQGSGRTRGRMQAPPSGDAPIPGGWNWNAPRSRSIIPLGSGRRAT